MVRSATLTVTPEQALGRQLQRKSGGSGKKLRAEEEFGFPGTMHPIVMTNVANC